MISVEVYGARFPRRTHPNALSLTDNEPMAATLRRLHGSQPGPGVAVLPPRLPHVPNDVFVSRVAARKTRRAGSAPRWVWFSRVEFAKGAEILSALSELKRGHKFDLYGPLTGDLKTFGLDRPNIRHRGLLPDVMAADFDAYDGFVFTSLFEGMPQVALEMCQHAIPMIAADVGGLGDTFGDSVLLVPHGRDRHESARNFASAMDELLAMTPDEICALTTSARVRALARHSVAAHARTVSDIFELG